MANVTPVKHICFIFLQISFAYHDFTFLSQWTNVVGQHGTVNVNLRMRGGVMRDGAGHGTGEEDKAGAKY